MALLQQFGKGLLRLRQAPQAVGVVQGQQVLVPSRSLQELTARASVLIEDANGLMTNNSSRVEQTVAALSQTAQTLNRPALSQQGSLAELLQNLRNASTGLDRIANDLSANPSALLFGQPPEPLPETR